MRVVFVHGALVRDGAWWWHRMLAPLHERGVETVAVELPSCGSATHGLHDDADAVREIIRPGDALLGHSYGGMVITDAAAGNPDVASLIYLTAMVPEQGMSMADLAGPEPAPFLQSSADGTVRLMSESLRELFMHDCDEDAYAGALQRLTPQSQLAFGQPVRGAGWRETSSTFIVCTDDRAVPAARQRVHAARTARVVEIATGHHPMLSHPELLAEAIRPA